MDVNDMEKIQAGDLTAQHIGRMVYYVGDGDGGRGLLPLTGIDHTAGGWTQIRVDVFGTSIFKDVRSGDTIRIKPVSE